MSLWNLAISIIFLSQTTTGILGNFSLIFYYLVLYCRKCTLKPTDVILMNVMAANALIILSTGVPQTMAVWGLKQFLNDIGCKLLLYIQGCGRSVSIGTTCLLSVFQALTICPKKYCWKNHKVKVEKYISCHIFLLWILYMSINFIYFSYTIFKRNSKNVSQKRDFGYCSTIGRDEIVDSLYAVLVVFPEVFLSVVIALSSGSMIVILYRHKQRIQHIRSTHGSSRMSPESRVTQNILILLSNFLAFYTLSSILRGYVAILNSHNWWLVNISNLTSLCFPSFGPFVLMNHYSILSRHF
ncbi:vomeronasal type-1 receptor 4-like [Arvicola amphibius]|uniref:vomeronasal type-1 receptor 4-like n=1 Tax=Arvicola amphibius TaxID=1047088 RepID=UPI0018E39C04|nr:vomeronasal type-1 receptor 4-like [Arvicola amphibius]